MIPAERRPAPALGRPTVRGRECPLRCRAGSEPRGSRL